MSKYTVYTDTDASSFNMLSLTFPSLKFVNGTMMKITGGRRERVKVEQPKPNSDTHL